MTVENIPCKRKKKKNRQRKDETDVQNVLLFKSSLTVDKEMFKTHQYSGQNKLKSFDFANS